MDRYSVESTTLTGIADAIREKTGGNEEIKVEDMAGKIGEISGGGEDVETVTITANGILTEGQISFCFYNEDEGYWDICYGGVVRCNAERNTYKVRKGSSLIVVDALYHFSPSNAVTNEPPAAYTKKIIADVTITYD